MNYNISFFFQMFEKYEKIKYLLKLLKMRNTILVPEFLRMKYKMN